MLQAATGFGFSLLAAPLLFAAIGPEPAVVSLLVLGLEVNVLTLGTERRRPRPLPVSTATILCWALPGALAGVAVLRALPGEALQVAYMGRRLYPALRVADVTWVTLLFTGVALLATLAPIARAVRRQPATLLRTRT